MGKDNTIKREVMKVVNLKIADKQKEYDDGCIELEDQLARDKEDLAKKKVEEIVGKIME